MFIIIFKNIGIIFEGARKTAVMTDSGASDISILNCTIRNTGFRGVTFTGGKHYNLLFNIIIYFLNKLIF